MKRGQVFVRAKDATGQWKSVDVLDLDQGSFNAFVMGVLFKHGLVTGIKDEFVNTPDLILTTKRTIK